MSLSNSASSESSLRKWNFLLLSAGVVIYFFVNFQRSSIPGTIFSELQRDFSATATQDAPSELSFLRNFCLAGVL